MKRKIFKSFIFPAALLITTVVTAQDDQSKKAETATPQATQVQDSKVARTPMTPEQRVEMRVKNLTEKLSLNADQQKKLTELFTAQDKAMRDPANRDQRMEARQKMMEDLNKILTPEQQAKMKEIQEGQKQKMMEKRSMQKQDDAK